MRSISTICSTATRRRLADEVARLDRRDQRPGLGRAASGWRRPGCLPSRGPREAVSAVVVVYWSCRDPEGWLEDDRASRLILPPGSIRASTQAARALQPSTSSMQSVSV